MQNMSLSEEYGSWPGAVSTNWGFGFVAPISFKIPDYNTLAT